jgi:3-oxoadipate enol-lactonase / 4-carboxymuconolactone decarboxylase
MPFAHSTGCRIFWRVEGDPAKPPLLLSNSLGTDHLLWQPVMAELTQHFYVLRYDKRGHGASDVPAGPSSMQQLAQDALAVADAAGVQRFHWCGVSIGGMIGMQAALLAPQRFISLVLCNTSAQIPPEVFQQRIDAVQAGGMQSVVATVLGRFFLPTFAARNPAHYHAVKAHLETMDASGYISCCAAIRDMQLAGAIGAIQTPTLIITGQFDQSTPPAMGQVIHAAIAGSQLTQLPTAHISASDMPATVAKCIHDFCLGTPALTEAQQYAAGLAKRKATLGVDYVQSRLKNVNSFNHDFQTMITQYAWGTIWTRGVLPDEVRRLLVLAMAATGARWEEYELHLRAALDAGLEETVLREVLMQLAIYSGVPAANTAFQIAQKLLQDRQSQSMS